MHNISLLAMISVLWGFGAAQRTTLSNVAFGKPHGHEYNVQNFYSRLVVNESRETRCERVVSQAIREARCMPRETVVHLEPSVYGLQMATDKIVVKRCLEIGCYGINSCVPTKTRQVQVPVVLARGKCAWLEIAEHTACSCKCSLDETRCGPHHRFVPEECSCRCRNHEEKTECRRAGKTWDERSCQCVCSKEWMDCSTGTEWVPRMCKCVRVMTDHDDNYNKYLML